MINVTKCTQLCSAYKNCLRLTYAGDKKAHTAALSHGKRIAFAFQRITVIQCQIVDSRKRVFRSQNHASMRAGENRLKLEPQEDYLSKVVTYIIIIIIISHLYSAYYRKKEHRC